MRNCKKYSQSIMACQRKNNFILQMMIHKIKFKMDTLTPPQAKKEARKIKVMDQIKARKEVWILIN